MKKYEHTKYLKPIIASFRKGEVMKKVYCRELGREVNLPWDYLLVGRYDNCSLLCMNQATEDLYIFNTETKRLKKINIPQNELKMSKSLRSCLRTLHTFIQQGYGK